MFLPGQIAEQIESQALLVLGILLRIFQTTESTIHLIQLILLFLILQAVK